MVSVMSFIVYGGVSDEGVEGIVPMRLVLFRRERTDVLTLAFAFSFSLHSCRAARRSAAFSSKESPRELHHLGSRFSAEPAK